MFSRREHVTMLDYATLPLEPSDLVETSAFWKPTFNKHINMPICLLL